MTPIIFHVMDDIREKVEVKNNDHISKLNADGEKEWKIERKQDTNFLWNTHSCLAHHRCIVIYLRSKIGSINPQLSHSSKCEKAFIPPIPNPVQSTRKENIFVLCLTGGESMSNKQNISVRTAGSF